MVPTVGDLITQEPSELLGEHHKTKLHCIIGWNLKKFAYQVFIQEFRQKSFEILMSNRYKSAVIFPALCVPP